MVWPPDEEEVDEVVVEAEAEVLQLDWAMKASTAAGTSVASSKRERSSFSFMTSWRYHSRRSFFSRSASISCVMRATADVALPASACRKAFLRLSPRVCDMLLCCCWLCVVVLVERRE